MTYKDLHVIEPVCVYKAPPAPSPDEHFFDLRDVPEKRFVSLLQIALQTRSRIRFRA